MALVFLQLLWPVVWSVSSGCLLWYEAQAVYCLADGTLKRESVTLMGKQKWCVFAVLQKYCTNANEVCPTTCLSVWLQIRKKYFWVGPRVPIGPARPKASGNLGRPVALQIGLEATGPGPRPGPGRPIRILTICPHLAPRTMLQRWGGAKGMVPEMLVLDDYYFLGL
jgi:hypothetical protein